MDNGSLPIQLQAEDGEVMLAVVHTGLTITTLTDSTANGDELIMAKVMKGQKATYSADK